MAKMTPTDWESIRWFVPREFPEPQRMDYGLIVRLDAMRQHSGKPFTVHYSTDGVHSPGSTHYDGEAVDGHVHELSILEQYLLAESFNWPAIGIYPYWNNPGLHLDSRKLLFASKGARWWMDKDGKFQAITKDLIKDLATIW